MFGPIQNNLFRFIGYLLFFVSDSLLLLEKSYVFPFSAIVILSTYFASQYLIMWGGLQNIYDEGYKTPKLVSY